MTQEKFSQKSLTHADVPQATYHIPKTSANLIVEKDNDAAYFRALEQQGVYLNEKQLEAVQTTEGPVLTLAGAGSGKTSVLTTRVGYLINVKNVHPRNILLLTFTQKAAEEIRSRVANLPGMNHAASQYVVAGTFHSVFLKLLRSQGYNQQILANEKHKQIMIKKILKELRLKDDYDAETMLAMISLEKNKLNRPKDVKAKTPVEQEFREVYERYEDVKQRYGYIDFDDILLETFYMLENNAPLLTQLQNRFHYIEVDEFQDTSYAQYEIVKLLASPRNNLFIAGDDDQAIYGWRGASHQIILSFPKEFDDTTIIALNTNYRSNPFIVGLGNEVIKLNQERFKKELYSVHEEGTQPFYARPATTLDEANQILQLIQDKVASGEREYKDFCLLYRTHSVSRSLLDQLAIHKIPFIKHGASQSFYEHSLIKPVLDQLRLAYEPFRIESLSSILPTMYIGRDECISFIEREQWKYGEGRFPSLLHFLLLNPSLKPFQVKKINERIDFIKFIKELEPKKALKEIIKGKGKYLEYLQSNDRSSFTMHKDIQEEMLEELMESATRFTDIPAYLEFISAAIQSQKEMEALKTMQQKDAVSLMSIHNAKGLEFPCVFLLGASDGILPHSSSLKDANDRVTDTSEALEEERRLMYVAITRAKEELYISSPQFFRGKKLDVSRFLYIARKDLPKNPTP
ncbi:ATP-dependent DNA helicase [Bacillus pseudomycoides]|uniref:ATP-dependent helicase n=1 Tax=Bacillus pseudomycoides TaxID=64104 RepID=UPI000BED4369|nr:ATP-dependent helicase [Bacillus pseudomycoides]PDZ11381.1 ATP-dependent DNA helicase [Bacillus pseudomycoides]